MDEAGFEMAHIAGNSLGGFVALAARRARAGAIGRGVRAGGRVGEGRRLLQGDHRACRWRCTSRSRRSRRTRRRSSRRPRDAGGRPACRRRTSSTSPPSCSPTRCSASRAARARRRSSSTRCAPAGRSTPSGSPARCAIVWGTEDKLLPWPSAALRFREELAPARRLGRARRHRPLPAARRPARGGAAHPGVHRGLRPSAGQEVDEQVVDLAGGAQRHPVVGALDGLVAPVAAVTS